MNKEMQIPRNVDAEVAVLGSIFLDESLIVGLLDQLSVDDFFDQRNKIIYKTILELNRTEKSIDHTSIISALEASGKLDAIGGYDYVNTIANYNYTSVNIETYVALVKEASLKRQAITRLGELAQKGYDPNITSAQYLTTIEEVIFDLSKRRKTTDFTDINTVASRVLDRIKQNSNHLQDDITGISTGYKNINKVILGFQPEQLIILAARPGMGKSALAMNIAVNVAQLNQEGNAKVAIFSLEMGMDQLVERMVACESNIPLGNIKTANMDGTEIRRFVAACQKLSKLHIYFDDSSSTSIEDIRVKCRKQQAATGLDFVVIDYLQLIDGANSGAKSRQEEVAKISRGLKMMARELQIPVLALAQLSREVDRREDKKPVLADLRDSGSIEQDADIVTFLYREDYYKANKDKPEEQPISSPALLNIAKNRSGEAGVDLDFIFQGRYSKFVETEKGEN